PSRTAPRQVSRKELKQRHHDPVAAERPASPETGVDGDQGIRAGRSPRLKNRGPETRVGRADREADLLQLVSAATAVRGDDRNDVGDRWRIDSCRRLANGFGR